MKSKKRNKPAAGAAPAGTRPEARERRAPAFQPRWWHYGVGVFLMLFLGFEVYGPALRGPFLFDDVYLPFLAPGVAEQPLRAWIAGVRPVLMASFWLNYQVSGLEPYSYHVVNVLLHILNSLLALLIVRRLLGWTGETGWRRDGLSLFASLLFLLHPLQTESVAYVASRSEVLSVFFFLAAFAVFLYRRHEAISWLEAAAVLALFGAAALSKEHTTVLPALLVLTDLSFRRGPLWRRVAANWRLYVPLLVAAGLAGAAVWRTLSSAPSAGFRVKDFTWYEYLFTQFRATWGYLRLYVFPLGQNIDHEFRASRGILDPWAIAGLVGLAAAAAAAWRYRERFPLACYGYFGFLLLLAPTSSFIPIQDVFVERRVYLPFVCLLVVTVDLVRRWRAGRSTLAVALSGVLVIAAAAAWQRNHVWASPLALWDDTTRKAPGNHRAHFQLAFAYYQAGRCTDAVREYARAARLTKPDHRLLVDWALAYDCAGQPEEALAKFQEAAAIEQTAHVYSQIGMIHAKQGRDGPALEALDKAEKLDPGFDMTYVYRGHVFLNRGDAARAAEQYRRALAINPRNQLAQQSLAEAAQRLGARR
ncbi:MAG: hypothetical protein HYZ57_04630 [Acidobacteria bacterium]|nr:hypothetical protein [Acidobacteriota bacterium]